jgi:hypothetical protein
VYEVHTPADEEISALMHAPADVVTTVLASVTPDEVRGADALHIHQLYSAFTCLLFYQMQ